MDKAKNHKLLFIFGLILSVSSVLRAEEYLPKNLFVELGKKVNPAVVNIFTIQRAQYRGNPMGPYGMPQGDPFREFFERFMGPQGPMGRGDDSDEPQGQSLGSGFIIESNGLILTNAHVIMNGSEVRVRLTEKSKKNFKAKVIGQDARTDLALIKVETNQKLPFVSLGDSDKVEVGEWVAAFGNPFGYGHSMTKGIISAKERDLETPNQSYATYLQTDASINPGNSGGPLVNSKGEVIGVNTAIDARAQGIGFAIPINVAKKLIPDLKTKGKVIRGFLGVGIHPVDEKVAKTLKLQDEKGAFVVQVTKGSPAAKAGVRPYDVILEANGKEVESPRALTQLIAETPIGSEIKMKLLREGKTLEVSAKVSQRPDEQTMAQNTEEEDESAPESKGKWAPFGAGFAVADLTPQLSKRFRIPQNGEGGAVIISVKRGSLAHQAGLMPGDVILDINRVPVKKAATAFKSFARGNNVIRAQRGEDTFLVFMETE